MSATVTNGTGHARLSASSAERWMNCPGSVKLIESVPPGQTPFVAAEGTFAHYVAAQCLAGRKLDSFLDAKGVVDGHEITCDADMIEGVGLYLNTVGSIKLKQEWSELSLHAPLRHLDPDLGGTADYVTFDPERRLLRVVDFKYGAGVFVSAEDNKQLKKYALGALLEIERQAGLGAMVSTIEVYIVQPRYEGAEAVRKETFLAEELLDFIGDMLTAARQTREGNAPIVAGPWCKKTFCPAAHVCPALEKMQHALVAVEFNAVTPINVQALGRALTEAPLVEERIKAIREMAYQHVLAGGTIPGWKLVDKKPRRCWTEPDKVIEWAKKRAIEPFETPELKSPAQMEKGLKAAEKRELEPWTAKVSSGTTLAPQSDVRQPVSRAVTAADFTVVSESGQKQLSADDIFK